MPCLKQVCFSLTLFACWFASDSSRMARAAERPNFIFVLLDDQGWSDAAAYGHPYIHSPNIDRLVRSGKRFTQFYVNNPVCSPSRTAFMTGQYPARHRIHEHLATGEQNFARDMPNWLDPQVTTVCDLLKSAGYATAHFGKWHLGAGPQAPGLEEYGIDVSKTVNSPNPAWRENNIDHFRARSTGLLVDETIKFIESHRDQPFYINLWTLVPHALLDPTSEELAAYVDLKAKPDDFPSWMRDYVAKAPHPSEQMRVFCAAMTGLDTQLGRLLDFLDKQDLAQNTVIVMSSDNGPEDYHIGNASNAGLGSPGVFRGRKRSLYEGGVRLPLVVRWPNHIAAGHADEASVVTAVDFLPTVCKLAGVDASSVEADGEDMSDVLLGESRPRHKSIYWEWRGNVAGDPTYKPPRLAIRQGKWKLFVEHDGSGAQLYDIPADSEERTDLASRQPEVVQTLSSEVLAWSKTLPK